MANRTIQLLRNTSILASLAEAKTALKTKVTMAKDGEIALARYNAEEDGATVVKTLAGVYHVTDTTRSVTLLLNDDEFNSLVQSMNGSVTASTTYGEITVTQSAGILSAATLELDYGTFDKVSGTATPGIAKIEDVVNIAKYTADSLYMLKESGSGTIKETYKLMSANSGEQLGDTIAINVDQAFQTAKMVSSGETYHGTTYTEDTLVLTYINASGDTVDAGVPVGAYLKEAEFKDGLEVRANEVYVKIDTASTDNYLTVSANGLNLSGIGTAIENAISQLTLTSPKKTLNVTTATSGTTADVNNDELTIKQYVDEATNGFSKSGIDATELYAADAVIEQGFTVLGGTVGQLSSGTKISGGTTVIELLKRMLVKEADCSPVLPTATLSINNTTSPVEVGTILSETMTVSYADGKFTGKTDDYGYAYSVNAGCSAGDITYKRGSTTLVTQSATSYTDSDYTMLEGTTTWSVTEAYGASTVTPKKNNGTDSSQKIAAGNTTSSSKSITAQYKYYYGSTTADTVDAVATAGLSTGWTTVDGTTTIVNSSTKYTLPTNYFVIMCEEKYKLNSIQDYIFGTDYKINFTVTGTKTINIGGTSKATYNVYIWTKDPVSQPDVKNITLAKA